MKEQYEEMKAYAVKNPITSEDNDEEAMKYLKENVSIDFFLKIFFILFHYLISKY